MFRLAMHRAARRQRHHLTVERSPNRFVHAEAHAADLLDEKFAAAGGALVVRQDVADPAVGNDVNQERLAAKRHHSVKIGFHLAQCALNRRSLRNMAQTARYAEIIDAGEILFNENIFQNRQRAALVWHNRRKGFSPVQRGELDRQGADIHADKFHGYTGEKFSHIRQRIDAIDEPLEGHSQLGLGSSIDRWR